MQDSDPHADTERLLGMIAALGAEVFVLKAEVQRLKRALQSGGALTDAQLEKAAASPELAQWMSEEERTFGATLMRPFAHPDDALDVAKMMTER
jgi:hypothetical protein